MSPVEFRCGERAQRVAVLLGHSLLGPEQLQNRFVQVPSDGVEREAVYGPGALTVSTQVYGDRMPASLREPRPDPLPGT